MIQKISIHNFGRFSRFSWSPGTQNLLLGSERLDENLLRLLVRWLDALQDRQHVERLFDPYSTDADPESPSVLAVELKTDDGLFEHRFELNRRDNSRNLEQVFFDGFEMLHVRNQMARIARADRTIHERPVEASAGGSVIRDLTSSLDKERLHPAVFWLAEETKRFLWWAGSEKTVSGKPFQYWLMERLPPTRTTGDVLDPGVVDFIERHRPGLFEDPVIDRISQAGPLDDRPLPGIPRYQFPWGGGGDPADAAGSVNASIIKWGIRSGSIVILRNPDQDLASEDLKPWASRLAKRIRERKATLFITSDRPETIEILAPAGAWQIDPAGARPVSTEGSDI